MKFRDRISGFVESYNYDIRLSGNGRWIDQKCTPDVVAIVADCVINFAEEVGIDAEFTSTDIWDAEYTMKNVLAIFNKPKTNEPRSRNEYDKFFAQPLELLAYSGILNKYKKGRQNIYSINELELLDNIGSSTRKSYIFLVEYITSVLIDSELMEVFEFFFNQQTPESYDTVKSTFSDFTHQHTQIRGEFEPNRIFSKVINPLACSRELKGTVRGRISKNAITYSELMYNRLNIRDEVVEKPKNITRQEWLEQNQNAKISEAVIRYQAVRAQEIVNRFNKRYFSGETELQDEYSAGPATQMHHIFPQSRYPEISMYVENIIALTPTQHFAFAHPGNNTNRIDPIYQEACLKAKLGTIKLSDDDPYINSIYSFENFIYVLNVGFSEDIYITNNDYYTVTNVIEEHYADYY